MTSPSDSRASAPLQPERDTGRPVEPGITRRALLRAAPAVALVAAAPTAVRAMSAPPVSDPENTEVARAIRAHKECSKALHQAIDREWEIEEQLHGNPAYEARPQVCFGDFLQFANRDAGPVDIRAPLYATSLEELDELCKSACSTNRVMWNGNGIEKIQQRYAGLKAELTRKIRRKRRLERSSGFIQAIAATHVANLATERAVVGVLLARPANDAERAAKAKYMRRNIQFTADWWNADDLMDAIAHHMGKVL